MNDTYNEVEGGGVDVAAGCNCESAGCNCESAGCGRWHAMKVFFNRGMQLKEELERKGVECYLPMHTVMADRGRKRQAVRKPLVSSLLFFRCEDSLLKMVAETSSGRAMIYKRIGTENREAAVIPDREMEIFILVTSSGDNGLELLDEDNRKFDTGQPVRVTQGPLAGAEGKIVRIRGDHRLVVSVKGVCAVATSYIPKCFLEPI